MGICGVLCQAEFLSLVELIRVYILLHSIRMPVFFDEKNDLFLKHVLVGGDQGIQSLRTTQQLD